MNSESRYKRSPRKQVACSKLPPSSKRTVSRRFGSATLGVRESDPGLNTPLAYGALKGVRNG